MTPPALFHQPPPAPDLRPEPSTIGRPPTYPWDSWLDGERAYVLEAGVHFRVSPTSLVSQARKAAAARDVELRYYYEGDTLARATQLTIWAEATTEKEPR